MPKARWRPKLVGEQGECAFQLAALRRGFGVAKPYGDSLPYDFIVDPAPGELPTTLYRVQVKASTRRRSGVYGASARNTDGTPLTVREADFLVVWIVTLDDWYVIPVHDVGEISGLALFPHVPASRSRFEKYRRAWHLMKRPHV